MRLRSNHQENSSYLSTGVDSSEHGKLSHLLRTELFCLHLVTKAAASMSHAAEQPLALKLKVKTVRWHSKMVQEKGGYLFEQQD